MSTTLQVHNIGHDGFIYQIIFTFINLKQQPIRRGVDIHSKRT